jgi:hypothetical protein
VLSTVVNCFGLPKRQLGKRQAKAPDVSEALNLDVARQDLPPIVPPAGWNPSLEARVVDSTRALLHAKGKPISHLQHRILVGAAHRMKVSPGRVYEASQLDTALEGDAFLMKLEAERRWKKLL